MYTRGIWCISVNLFVDLRERCQPMIEQGFNLTVFAFIMSIIFMRLLVLSGSMCREVLVLIYGYYKKTNFSGKLNIMILPLLYGFGTYGIFSLIYYLVSKEGIPL